MRFTNFQMRFEKIVLLILTIVLSNVLAGCAAILDFESSYRHKILKEPVLGATKEAVLEYIESSDWKHYRSEDQELRFHIDSKGRKRVFSKTRDHAIGSSYINAFIEPGALTSYHAIWIFDEDDCLIDVFVEKQVHSVV